MNNKERIFREVTAAIIGSKLKISDLRELADLLSSPSFARELARTVYELSIRFEPSSVPFEDDYTVEESSIGGLAELAYGIVQRRRLSKPKVLEVIKKSSPAFLKRISTSVPLRALLEDFFENAPVAHQQRFLAALGVSLPDDPYLAGVSSRVKLP